MALPIIAARIDDHAPQRVGHIVPWLPCSSPVASRWSGNAFSVRVEQHIFWVEPEPALGIKGSGDTIGINLTHGYAGHKNMPIMIGTIGPRVEMITRDGVEASTSSNSSSC